MPQTQANGITIEYETFGDPNDPAILLIMGLSMQLIAWPTQFCQALADAGYFVIRFDNRDAGLSQKIEGKRSPHMLWAIALSLLGRPVNAPYTLRDMALDSVGLLDALEIEKAHMVGASMGGMIAQILATHHPTRVHSLTSIMSSPGNFRHALPTPRIARHMFLTKPKSSSVEDLLAYTMPLWKLLDSPTHPRTDQEWRQVLVERIERSYYPAGYPRQTCAILATGDRRKELQQITCPTLVIHGLADGLVPPAAGRETAACIPGAVLRILDGMGHQLSSGLLPTITDWILAHLQDAGANETC
jgi:pimeloyl-ACP methyl ester carboxylesterase